MTISFSFFFLCVRMGRPNWPPAVVDEGHTKVEKGTKGETSITFTDTLTHEMGGIAFGGV